MLGLPKLSADPVLFLPLWLGTTIDAAGGVTNLTPGAHWGQRGQTDAFVNAGLGLISAPNSALIGSFTDFTLFVSGHFSSSANPDQRLLYKRLPGTHVDIFRSGNLLNIYDGSAVASTAAIAFNGAKSLAISLTSGGVANACIDASTDYAFGVASTITPSTDDAAILNNAVGASPWVQPVSMYILYPGDLAADEIAELHDYSQSRITPRKQWPGMGLRYPDRETNLYVDPTDPASWIVNNAAVITAIDDGIRVAYGGTNNPFARQNILVADRQQHTTLQCRSDGVAIPDVFAGAGAPSFTGTNSTDWQDVDELEIADFTLAGCRCLTAIPGYCEFRRILATTNPPGYTPATGDPMFLDNIQSARVTLADETSGQLSNTGLGIVTGTWALTESAAGRAITCVVAGQLKPVSHLVGASTWTTDVFTETGGVTLTKNAADFTLDATAGDTITALQLTAP